MVSLMWAGHLVPLISEGAPECLSASVVDGSFPEEYDIQLWRTACQQ